jgi:hypothetical protein
VPMAWLLTHKYPFLQAWASDSFNTFRKLNQPLSVFVRSIRP